MKIIQLLIRYVPRPYLLKISLFASKFTYVFYHGSNFYCPCCKGHFRKFLPYGRINPRYNVLCPGCFSLERHRLIWLYLENKTNLFSDKLRLLHFAPEQCFISQFKSMNNLDYVTADIESPLAMMKMDITDIPFEDNSFDVILCNHLLEHVEDDRKAMREMYRVLRKNGWAIIQPHIDIKSESTLEDPSVTSPEERERLFNQRDHVRVYGLDYTNRLQEAGFIVHVEPYLKDGAKEELKRFALLPIEDIYLCTKPK